MREDVITVIKGATDVTNAIVLTHNVDFVFLQSVVIPALRRCGAPALTVFADADCAEHSYQYQARALSGLGTRYRVVPVAMRNRRRFHPKALLLSGPKKATLLVGSGNLTFGGWRENGELWCRYDTAQDGTGPFSDFLSYLGDVVDLVPLAEAVRSEVEEPFDSKSRDWAKQLAASGDLLGCAGQGQALLERMKALLGEGPVDHLYVCAPYFDEEAAALQSLARGAGARAVTVLVQRGHCNLLAEAAVGLGPEFRLRAATYRHTEERGGGNSARESFLHAKFYAFQRGEEVVVFAGSANCSRAALTLPGSAANAELLARLRFNSGEFEQRILGELALGAAEVELATRSSIKPTDDQRPDVSILAARMEAGQIRVAFRAIDGFAVTGAEVEGTPRDGTPQAPVSQGDGWVGFASTGDPRTIVLIGVREGSEVRSRPHWIDNEYALRVSARGRSLGDTIDNRVRDGTWNLGAWTEVLAELHKNLEYMPKSAPRGWAAARSRREQSGPIEFAWGDVFSSGYGLSLGLGRLSGLRADPASRIAGLRAMLLRWYGINPSEEAEDGAPDDEASVTPSGSPAEEGDLDADRPKALPRKPEPPAPPPSGRPERKRAVKLVRQITRRMSEPSFLSERPPELLVTDLKVAAVVLRAGLAERWLTEDEFFEATLEYWLPLFFSAGGTEPIGWLEKRHREAPDKLAFEEAMGSVQLAAALGSLALVSPSKATSLDHARFELASALGVARLPWLWQRGDNQELAKEMSELLAHTASEEVHWSGVEGRWLTLVRRGAALNQLESAVELMGPRELSERIRQPRVQAGELLLQRPYGFCVAVSECDRAEGRKIPVRILQQRDATKVFTGPFLTPVAGLLEPVVADDLALPERAREELDRMVAEIRAALQQRRSVKAQGPTP